MSYGPKLAPGKEQLLLLVVEFLGYFYVLV